MNAVAAIRRVRDTVRAAATSSSRFSADPAKRESDRNRRAALSGLTAAAARLISIASSLVTVPLTIRYLGTERFGLWMTVTSFLFMAAFADFGLGNGLLTLVARAHGKDDMVEVRKALSSAMGSLTLIAIGILIFMFSIYRWVDWADLFRVTSAEARSEAGPTLLVFTTCVMLNLPAGVVQRTQIGLQQGFRTNFWQLIGSVVGLAGVLACLALHLGLPALVLAVAGAPLLATTANAAIFFGVTRPDLRPAWSLVSRRTVKQIMSVGIFYFALQVLGAIAYSADNFVIARTLGAITVPEYAVPQRVFSLISTVIAMLVSPLWAAYGEALCRGDHAWVRRSLRRSLTLSALGASAASLIFLALAKPIIHWWVGPAVNPPLFLLVGLALWTVMECCGSSLSMFLNGSGLMRFQLVTATLFGVTCIVAKIYLARRFGVAGIPWATVVTAAAFNYVPLLFYVRRKMRQLPNYAPHAAAT